jgi:hypothetical protein
VSFRLVGATLELAVICSSPLDGLLRADPGLLSHDGCSGRTWKLRASTAVFPAYGHASPVALFAGVLVCWMAETGHLWGLGQGPPRDPKPIFPIH